MHFRLSQMTAYSVAVVVNSAVKPLALDWPFQELSFAEKFLKSVDMHSILNKKLEFAADPLQ